MNLLFVLYELIGKRWMVCCRVLALFICTKDLGFLIQFPVFSTTESTSSGSVDISFCGWGVLGMIGNIICMHGGYKMASSNHLDFFMLGDQSDAEPCLGKHI